MWILIKKTYISPLGCFVAGHKYDPLPEIIEQLPRHSFKKTCAPWDEHKDIKAIEQAQLKARARDAQVWADVLQDRADEAKQRADSLVAGVAKLQAKAKEAEAAAVKVIAEARKKNATNETQKHALGLAREAERKDLLSQKAHAELAAAIAEQGLKRLEAEDAKRKAKQAAKEAGLPVDEPIDGPVDKQVDGVAEGQTVSP